MEYRVIILKNNKYLKTIYKCKKRSSGFSFYNTAVGKNNNIIFPKKHVNSNGIMRVNYKICLVKDYEKDDVKKYIIDEYGRNIYLGKIDGKWSLVNSEDYLIEEKFYIYTHDHKQYKAPIKDIIKILTRYAYKKSAMKQVILIYNKILIYDEDFTDVIICKCVKDAERLHYDLYRVSKKVKIKTLIFNGNPTKEIITMCYERIMGHTKWSHSKVRKQNTYK